MSRVLKVAVVEYLNTAPYLYGLNKNRNINTQLAYPAVCSDLVLEKKVDIGLIPVATIFLNPQLRTHTVYGIGCDGEVNSVMLVGDAPVEEMEAIYPDYQSRTSNLLMEQLLEKYWQVRPQLLEPGINYESAIGGATGGLIIGDRALKHQHQWKFAYDLGSAWKDLTGLPFVFARWAGLPRLSDLSLSEFENTVHHGILNLDKVVEFWQNKIEKSHWNIRSYLTERIQYEITPKMEEGQDLFRKMVANTAAAPVN